MNMDMFGLVELRSLTLMYRGMLSCKLRSLT